MKEPDTYLTFANVVKRLKCPHLKHKLQTTYKPLPLTHLTRTHTPLKQIKLSSSSSHFSPLLVSLLKYTQMQELLVKQILLLSGECCPRASSCGWLSLPFSHLLLSFVSYSSLAFAFPFS